MTEIESNLLPRREFLRCVIGVAGAAALGLEMTSAKAETGQTNLPLAIAYWNGARLVDARSLPAGDAALCSSGVRVTVQRHGGGNALRAINAYYPIQIDGREQHVPFHAWTVSAQGNGSSFTLPVAHSEGILLSALHDGTETFIRLHTDTLTGKPKLRTGQYVLAIGAVNWAGCHFDPDALCTVSGPLTQRTLSGFIPVSFGYRVISVTPA